MAHHESEHGKPRIAIKVRNWNITYLAGLTRMGLEKIHPIEPVVERARENRALRSVKARDVASRQPVQVITKRTAAAWSHKLLGDPQKGAKSFDALVEHLREATAQPTSDSDKIARQAQEALIKAYSYHDKDTPQPREHDAFRVDKVPVLWAYTYQNLGIIPGFDEEVVKIWEDMGFHLLTKTPPKYAGSEQHKN